MVLSNPLYTQATPTATPTHPNEISDIIQFQSPVTELVKKLYFVPGIEARIITLLGFERIPFFVEKIAPPTKVEF